MAVYEVQEKTLRASSKGYTIAEIRYGLRDILVAFIFESAFLAITTGAVFSSFLTKHLRVDDVWYGIILAAAQGTVFLQYWGSLAAERTGLLKPKYIGFCTPQSLLWLGVAAIPLLLVEASVTVKAAAMAVCVLISQTLNHLGKGGTLAWLSGLVPPSISGTYFGRRQRIGMIATLLTTIGVALLIDRFPGQGWTYALVFALATLCSLTTVILLGRVAEIPQPVSEHPPTLRGIVTTPWRHTLFRQYIPLAAGSAIITAMLDPFIWRYCFERRAMGGLELSVSTVNILLFIIPTLIMAWMAPYWGKMIDRHGPRPVLNACMSGLIVAPLIWVAMRPGLVWLIPAPAVLSGIFTAGLAQVDVFMRVKGFPEQRRTSYLASLNVMNGVAVMCGTALGGILATFWHARLADVPLLPAWISQYHPMFLTAILLRVLLFVGIARLLPLPGEGGGTAVMRKMIAEALRDLPGVKSLSGR